MTYYNYARKLENRIKTFLLYLANCKVSDRQYNQVLDQITNLKNRNRLYKSKKPHTTERKD